MFVLISIAAGLGGGLAHRLLSDKELALFQRQFEDAVGVLEVRVRRAISDRLSTVTIGGELFPFPPGGKARQRHRCRDVILVPLVATADLELEPSRYEPTNA